MELNLSSGVVASIVSKLIQRKLRKKFGKSIKFVIDPLDIRVDKDVVRADASVSLLMNKDDFQTVLEKINVDLTT